jgi:hypothetical protein
VSLVLVMMLDLVEEKMPQLQLSAAEGLLRRVVEQRQSHLGLLSLFRSVINAALHEVSQSP